MSPSPHRARPSPAAVQALARVSVAAGDLIRAERSRRKLTLRELAAHAGVSAAAIAHVEAGHPASLETYARLATALEMRLELGLVDPRRRTGPSREADLVHAAMGDAEARHLRSLGFDVGLDMPYQHYQFAGRADLLAWDRERRSLLHVENRTRFPNLQPGELPGCPRPRSRRTGRATAPLHRPGRGHARRAALPRLRRRRPGAPLSPRPWCPEAEAGFASAADGEAASSPQGGAVGAPPPCPGRRIPAPGHPRPEHPRPRVARPEGTHFKRTGSASTARRPGALAAGATPPTARTTGCHARTDPSGGPSSDLPHLASGREGPPCSLQAKMTTRTDQLARPPPVCQLRDVSLS